DETRQHHVINADCIEILLHTSPAAAVHHSDGQEMAVAVQHMGSVQEMTDEDVGCTKSKVSVLSTSRLHNMCGTSLCAIVFQVPHMTMCGAPVGQTGIPHTVV